MLEFKLFLESTENEVIHMYHNGNPISEIERETNRTRGDIYRVLGKHKVNPSRLKTKHQLIKYLVDAGQSTKEISNYSGMSLSGVRKFMKYANK